MAQAWDVVLNGKVIDTVFYNDDLDASYVYDGLVNHDGYDSRIKLRKKRSKQTSVKQVEAKLKRMAGF